MDSKDTTKNQKIKAKQEEQRTSNPELPDMWRRVRSEQIWRRIIEGSVGVVRRRGNKANLASVDGGEGKTSKLPP
ncbi:hypothetical protein CsSME_00046636 [Camellia sinensis var. sinensis]